MAGGDDDVPYRNRDRSRAAVARERQAVRNRNAPGDGDEWGMEGLEDADDSIGDEAKVRLVFPR